MGSHLYIMAFRSRHKIRTRLQTQSSVPISWLIDWIDWIAEIKKSVWQEPIFQEIQIGGL